MMKIQGSTSASLGRLEGRWKHVANALVAIGLVSLAAGWITYRVTREPVRVIKVRWAEGVSAAERQDIQRQLFMRCAAENPDASRTLSTQSPTLDEETRRQLSAEARTDVCDLLVWTPQNLEAIAKSPSVEDTAGFDRAAYVLPENPRLGTTHTWAADRHPLLRRQRYVWGAVLFAVALVISGLAPRPAVRRSTRRLTQMLSAPAYSLAAPIYRRLQRPVVPGRAWVAGAAVIAAIPLMIHAHAATHSRFLADDYCSAAAVESRGVLGMTIGQYLEWSGRYTAHALDGIVVSLGPVNAGFAPGVTLLLLGLALTAYLGRAFLDGLARDVRTIAAAGWSIFILSAVFFMTPDVLESLHWGQGMRTVLPSILIGIVLARLLSNEVASVSFLSSVVSGFSRTIDDWRRFDPLAPFCALLAFLACGVGETSAAVQTTTLFLFALYQWTRGAVGQRLVWTIAGSLAGSVLVVLSPGNATRRSFFPEPPGPVELLEIAVGTTAQFVGRAFTEFGLALGGVFIAGFCLALLARTDPRRSPARAAEGNVRLIWLTVCTLIVLFAAFLPAAHGLSAAPPPRTQVIPTFVIVAATTLTGYYFAAWWGGARRVSPFALRGVAAACLVVGLMNTWAFAREAQVRGGRVIAEAPAWDERDALIRRQRDAGATFVIVPVERDNWAGLEGVGPDPQFWVNSCVSSYYDVTVLGR